MPQRGLGFAVLAGGDAFDAHVGAESEQHQQQPAAQQLAGNDLAGGHRGELLGEAGEQVGFFEQIQ